MRNWIKSKLRDLSKKLNKNKYQDPNFYEKKFFKKDESELDQGKYSEKFLSFGRDIYSNVTYTSKNRYPKIYKYINETIIPELEKRGIGRGLKTLKVNVIGAGIDLNKKAFRDEKKIRGLKTYQPEDIEEGLLKQGIKHKIIATDTHPKIIKILRKKDKVKEPIPNIKRIKLNIISDSPKWATKKGDITIYSNVSKHIFNTGFLEEEAKELKIFYKKMAKKLGIKKYEYEELRKKFTDDEIKKIYNSTKPAEDKLAENLREKIAHQIIKHIDYSTKKGGYIVMDEIGNETIKKRLLNMGYTIEKTLQEKCKGDPETHTFWIMKKFS